MISNNLQFGVDSLSGRKAGHLDQPATQILSRNTARGIDMKQIKLTQGKVALVDDEDFEWLNQWKWYAIRDNLTFYAVRKSPMVNRKTRQLIRMHRIILNSQDEEIVDHKDHNGLNNLRNNIRNCTQSQNQQNRIGRFCTSRFKGVSWRKDRKRWLVTIVVQKRKMYIGMFKSELDAAEAYNMAAKKHFGNFAYLNFIGIKPEKNPRNRIYDTESEE